jgi:hypothetical protein
VRVWSAAVAAALLLATLAGVRVFRPTDTVDAAHGAEPGPATATAVAYGELLHAPLIVAGRLRVYGAANRVWADGPVDAKMSTSAYWAFRRWPAQLVGVAVVADRLVVSQWSDGQLVALRPDTGRIAWRAYARVRTAGYPGRRTGAQIVYAPPDLLTGTAAGGRPVVVAIGADSVSALDADTGATLWRQPGGGDPTCRHYFTAPGLVVDYDECRRSIVDTRTLALGTRRDWPSTTGPVTPVGCAVGRSGCTGVAGPGGGWLIGTDGELTAAPHLTDRAGWLVGSTVVVNGVAARDVRTGAPLWRTAIDGDVVAVEPGAVHVLTRDRDLVTLDLATGSVRTALWAKPPYALERPWRPGYVYASHGYLVIERLQVDGRPEQTDGEYYLPVPTLLFTGS